MTFSGVPGKTRRVDVDALAAAYDAHGAAVYGLARRVTGNDDVAAQLTTEVFTSLRRVSGAGIESLRACVLTEVHRRAVEWSRRNNEGNNSVLPLEGFGELTGDERTVVAEAYFGGKTYDEVAEALGTSRAAVAQMMHEALHRIGTTSVTTPRLNAP